MKIGCNYNNFEIDAYFYYLVGKIDTYWKGVCMSCPNPFKKKIVSAESDENDKKEILEIFDLSNKAIPTFNNVINNEL